MKISAKKFQDSVSPLFPAVFMFCFVWRGSQDERKIKGKMCRSESVISSYKSLCQLNVCFLIQVSRKELAIIYMLFCVNKVERKKTEVVLEIRFCKFVFGTAS